MSVFPGATNTTINNGTFNAVSNVGVQNDIVTILHSHSATAGLLDARERFDAPKCDEGTRTSMIFGMKKFVQAGNASSSPALHWLHGPAGVGKSALAQSLSLLLKSEGDHAASFFFNRTSPGRNNGNRLVVTLAYQLAMTFPALQPFMLKTVRANPGIFTSSNAVQMQHLIIEPINKWRKKYNWSTRRWTDKLQNVKPHPRLILVDGLDECNDPDVQTDLILCIASAVRHLSTPFRFVLISRPESHILTTFELNLAFQGLDGVTITKTNLGDDEDADEQITTFLVKEFAEIRRVHPIRDFLPERWPRPDQIGQLVSKSSKGFIYPATVIRYIKMPHNRPDECLDRILGMSEIPTSDKPYERLDSLYRHIFASVPEANKSSVHNVFHCLVLPSVWDGSSDPAIIGRHFGYPPGHVQHVLRDLLCVVDFTSDGHIKILHASLPDFLLDRSRSGPLFIDVSDVHATAAASYLLAFLYRDEMAIRHDFPIFLDHLQEADLTNTLLNSRILQTDLLPRYRRVSVSLTAKQRRLEGRPRDIEIESIAFMIAYLLVLVIRYGPQDYINNQILAIKGYIFNLCPPDDRGFHAVLTMIPIFHKWKSTITHECLNRIFECEVTESSQNNTREAIFELHFLMMAYLHRDYLLKSSRSLGNDEMRYRREEWTMKRRHYWANIVVGRNYQ